MLRALRSRFYAGCAATGFRPLKGEAGGALVEYALIFMVFMTMLLGIFDFCRALYAYHFVSNAAREATRWAAVNGNACGGDSSCNGVYGMNSGPASQTDIQNYVKNHAPLGIDPTKLTTTPSWPVQAKGPTICTTTQNAQGCTVEVTVSYSFTFNFPFVHTNPVTLSSASEMIIAH
jgi:Flp pilus assembly protein TadG